MMSNTPMPARKPTAAGIQGMIPCSAAMSIAGLIKLHTDAAIITPAAKPKSAFWNKVLICFFMKNARADPSVVPARGTVSATTTPSIMVFTALRSSLARIMDNYSLVSFSLIRFARNRIVAKR